MDLEKNIKILLQKKLLVFIECSILFYHFCSRNSFVEISLLVIAIRQFVLFTAAMPTGWRQVGQTAFRPFDPDRASPVGLAPGDEVRFAPITADELSSLQDGDSLGGAAWETLL